MTNPLRELIANVELTKQDGYSHVEHRNARAALMGFMYDNAEAVADLIDAAQYFIDMLDEHEAAFGDKLFPKSSDKLRAALVKFTEGK